MKLPYRSTAPAIRERGGPLAGAARDRAGVVLEAARPHVAHAAERARDTLGPAVSTTASRVADSVGPAVQATATRVADVARDDVAPKVTAAVGAALLASEPVREEAMARGGAVIAALKGEVVPAPSTKSHKVRTSLGVFALLAAAGAAWTAFQRRRAADPWSVPAVPPIAAVAPVPSAPASTTTAPHGDPLLDESPVADPLLSGSVSDIGAGDGLADGGVTPIGDSIGSSGLSGADDTTTSLLPGGPDEDVKDLR